MKDKSRNLIVGGLLLFSMGYFYEQLLSMNASVTSSSISVSDWLEFDVWKEYLQSILTLYQNSVGIIDNVLMVFGALWMGIGVISWTIEHTYLLLCESLLYFITSIAFTTMSGYLTYFIAQFWWQAPVSMLLKVVLLGAMLLVSVFILLLPLITGVGLIDRFRQMSSSDTLQK